MTNDHGREAPRRDARRLRGVLSSSTGVLVVTALLSAGVFTLDVLLPLGVAAGILYVAVVLVSLASPRLRDTLIAAVGSTILTAIAFVISTRLAPMPEAIWMIVVNRVLMLFAIWVTVLLSLEGKQAQVRQAMMVRELDHRVRNNLAAVLSVADQTVSSSASLAEFTPAFAGRLRSMAIAHELLARSGWEGADLREMSERIVEPYRRGDPDRFSLEGPDVRLSAAVAPSISMVLQELAANAVKHGALSKFDGRVAIRWGREVSAEDAAQLRIVWSEAGGPPVGPPARSGFGTTLIDRLIAYQIKGHATLEFPREGVRCEIVVPLNGVLER